MVVKKIRTRKNYLIFGFNLFSFPLKRSHNFQMINFKIIFSFNNWSNFFYWRKFSLTLLWSFWFLLFFWFTWLAFILSILAFTFSILAFNFSILAFTFNILVFNFSILAFTVSVFVFTVSIFALTVSIFALFWRWFYRIRRTFSLKKFSNLTEWMELLELLLQLLLVNKNNWGSYRL